MASTLYPFLFVPLPQSQRWGGALISEVFERPPAAAEPVGRHWEIVDQPGRQSIVENGDLAGTPLQELIAGFAPALVGERHASRAPFPIQVSYLDTGEPLPVAVHPEQVVAGFEPNTLLWYVVAARERAGIRVGIKPQITQQQFMARLNSPSIADTIQGFPSIPGDAYYISPGRVHALDAGNLVLCIQSTETAPWVISDAAGRPQPPAADGGCSAADLALSCIAFQNRTMARIRGESSIVQRNRKVPLLTHCPAFQLDELRLVGELHDRTDGNSCHLLTALDGVVTIGTADMQVRVEAGRTALVPAALGYYSLTPASELTRVLRTSLPTG